MRYIIIFLVFLYPSGIFAQIVGNNNPVVTVSILAVGDLMCHAEQFDYALLRNGKFDFNPSFQFIKKYLINSDFSFGNLETVTGGKNRGYSTYPLFNSPDEYIAALKNSGFDLVTTANNHALDQGKIGIIRTIKELDKNKINYTGTFNSPRDRDSIRIFNIKGIKIAFLAYTYGTNGNIIPPNDPYLVNIIKTSLIDRDIKRARENGAEIVLVYFHFGIEYSSKPSSYQRDIVKNAINGGADIIIGSHPHVLQPVEYFKTRNARLDSGIIIYSMGNFFTAQHHRFTRAGAMFNFKISKNFWNDSIYISKVSYAPTFVFDGKVKNKSEYFILPSEEAIKNSDYTFLTSNDLFEIRQSIGDTRRILTRNTSKIKIYNYKQDIMEQLKELAIPSPLARPQIFWKLSYEKPTIFSLIYFSK
jgi:poly-gamma-glutamate capsule biosynthesis protein CapA/YwtB (metallophosphatase superfamily)